MQPTMSLSKSFRFGLALCLTGLLIVQLILPVQGVRAATTRTVNTLDSGGDGICDAHCSLRDAINLSSSGDSIDFAPALSGTITLDFYYLIVGVNLTIHGSPQVNISGGGAMTMFWLTTGANLTLDGLTIQDGYSNTQAGAIYNDSSTLTLTNSTIKNSSAEGLGGAIYSENGTLNISGCTLQDNTSTNLGGGISAYNSTVTVMNSTFNHNSSTGSGGGIHMNGGSLSVTNSTFINNSADWGGAIEIAASPITIMNSTFSGNSAIASDGAGGGIDIWTGQVTVTNSTFSGNSAWLGGAIYQGDTLTLINSTFSGNTASTDADAGGADIYNDGTLNFANSILANPVSGGDCVNGKTIGTNTNNLVEDGSCSAGLSGDPMLAALADNGGPTWTMALLPGSPAIDAGNSATCAAAPISGKDQRGVTRPSACDIGAFELSACTVTTNADSGPGSLREKIGDAGCYIIYFNASLSAGTISLDSQLELARNLIIDGSTVASKVTLDAGNLDYRVFNVNSGVTAALNNLIISHGSTTGSGGGIYTAGTLKVANSLIFNNSAGMDGGGIYNAAGGILKLTNSTFDSNSTSSGNGGGIYNQGTLTVEMSDLNENHAHLFGGGIYNQAGSVTVTNSTLLYNSACYASYSGTVGGGGGIHSNAGSLAVYYSIFAHNTTMRDGGAISLSTGSATVTNSFFADNHAELTGGAIYNGKSLTITGSTLYNNSAVYFGGGIDNYWNLYMSNSTLANNSAKFGGGIFDSYGYVLALTNNTISGNSANAGGGGGIKVQNERAMDFANNIIANSSAAGGDCAISSNTITRNMNNLDDDHTCSAALTGDPKLAALGNYGGPTTIFALQAGSPAIDAGSNTVCAAAPVNNLDQRGVTRPKGSACDIGAYEAQLHSIPLVTGWNLVSFNLLPVNTDIAAVLAGLSGQYSLVYAWDATASSWRIYDPTLGNLNDLNSLDEKMGFWIKMNSDQTLVVSGRSAKNTSIALKSGWNLVGYPSAVNGALPDVFGSHGLGTDFSLVYAYHAVDESTAWKLFDRAGNPLLNDLTELSPGWGYWIKTGADHTWSVP